MKNLSVNMQAMVLVLLSFASYNIADAFVKHTASIYYFAEAAFYPSIFYGFLVLIFHKKFGGIKSLITTKKKKLLLLRGLAGTGCYVNFVISLNFITLAECYTLLLTAPFWIAILSIFFFKEKIGLHRWLAITIGFTGVLLVMRPGIEAINPYHLLMIFSAFCFAFFIIFTKKIGPEEPLITMVLAPIMVEALFLIPLIINNGFQTNNLMLPQPEHFIFFAMAGFFFLIGTSLSSIGFSSGESSLLAPLHYSQIIWGILIGYFIFHEMPDNWTFVGSAIIVSSGIYLIYREHLAHKKLTQ